jgi:hypothetical protein
VLHEDLRRDEAVGRRRPRRKDRGVALAQSYEQAFAPD